MKKFKFEVTGYIKAKDMANAADLIEWTFKCTKEGMYWVNFKIEEEK